MLMLGNKFNKVLTTYLALNNVISWGTIQDITVLKFPPSTFMHSKHPHCSEHWA